MHKEEHCAQNKQWEQLKGFWGKVSQMSEQPFVYIFLERKEMTQSEKGLTKMLNSDVSFSKVSEKCLAGSDINMNNKKGIFKLFLTIISTWFFIHSKYPDYFRLLLQMRCLIWLLGQIRQAR